jgi:alkanesulfonate monooxygenase SsuD/methylene tetrahydromethanopterin reductase-like flavin-dependent oxidoreductase (luciferase family)
MRGRYWRLDDVTIRPRPLQSPRPPIIVGAQVPEAIARAARIGDGWLVSPLPKLAELADSVAHFAAARAKAGLPVSRHICRLLEVGCATDEAAALRRVAPFLLEKYRAYAAWGLEGLELDAAAPAEETLRRLATDRFAVGSPQQVADALVAQHHCGVTHLSMRVSWPGMAQEQVLEGLELLGRRVLPEVRRRTARAGSGAQG